MGGGGVIKLCLYIGICSYVILDFELQALGLKNDFLMIALKLVYTYDQFLFYVCPISKNQ